MALSDKMKDTLTNGDIPEKLPTFVTLCPKLVKQIQQRKAENASQN